MRRVASVLVLLVHVHGVALAQVQAQGAALARLR